MALDHAILVSLLEKPGSGYELARRFDRSIGYFWTATHQQIYRVLKRMESDGWVDVREVPQQARPDKKEYSVAAPGRAALSGWLHEPIEPESVRHDLAVKIRGAAFDDPAALIREVERHHQAHTDRLAHYLAGERRDFTGPEAPATPDAGQELQHVVLRGGIAYERMTLAWLDDVLATLHRLAELHGGGPGR
ncbi:DNA-binding transcriptional regulator, PadR family [Streptomyces sp. 2224.1]|uniref:PadR family transcriptional regulator n=1 Tax=unclassified Streptomyces TaxID=2593676 RepID=UPI000888C14A|nr:MULTISPECIES: PadR family transcriptional regulator [unclassified Streptomyces]PBC86543.1 DNA-binding PadR family transcriptional regulator [Streptomyces sp. 2321.6]SDQ80676.1 DNA-binding transcriptional regulator, PadR family [Streptomyces sp. KS_16]SED59958.1 DNA-binding transcriptional regulator, PadR family [Streptomyces sp. 2112.3]SED88756.1 DNA-binding transcriptional regulator, PadR family [Streptomyces sp. 2224.1]SEE01842.1 DNA-binding transcriptional regulator, PadR family [Strepto